MDFILRGVALLLKSTGHFCQLESTYYFTQIVPAVKEKVSSRQLFRGTGMLLCDASHGQCDVRPTVTFPAVEQHHC